MSQSPTRLMLLLIAAFLLSGQASARGFVVSGNLTFIDGVSKQPSEEGDPPGRPVLIPPLRIGEGRMVRVIVRRTTDDRIVGSGHTDSRGVFNVTADADPGDPLRVQFEGFNYASRIFANMDCGNDLLLGSGDPFTAPASGGVNIGEQLFFLTYMDVVSGRCGGFGEGDYTATVTFSAALNINNNLLHTRQYADANRDPAESDSIPRVDVEYCNDRWNSYDGDIVVTCYHSPNLDENFERVDWGYMDEASAHEFGHHLQVNIGARNGWVLDSKHSFCTQYTGRDNDRADFAFQEGWPDYLAAWLVTNNPEMVFPFGVFNVTNYDAPCVSNAASVPPLERGSAGSGVTFPDTTVFARWNHVEGLVTGFLFDLADGRGAGEDAWDLVDGPAISGDRKLFNIFDRELDRDGLGLFSNSPSLNDLYTAWVARYGDDLEDGWPALDLLLNGVGITPRTNALIEQLFPPMGIVGAIPNAGSTGAPLTISYAPLTNELTLQNRLSFARGDAVVTGTGIRTFVSNIGPGNAPWSAAHPKQAPGEGAASALYDVGPIAFSTIASVGGIEPTGWLAADLGSFLPGLLLPKRTTGFVLNEIDAVTLSMPRGTFIATVPVEFDITTESGASILQTREIVYELRILDTASDDSDRDGLDNQTERSIPCLDPLDPDTDGDGISDGDERNIYGTSPCSFDTDGDGQSDGAEIRLGCSNPNNPASAVADPGQDADGDGWINSFEQSFGTDPCDDDSDDDLVIDSIDNCPIHANNDQADDDEDGDGNRCDTDADGDGVPRAIDLDDSDPDVGLPREIARLEDMFVDVGIHDGFYRRGLPPLPLPFPDPATGDRRFFSDDGTIGELMITDFALNDIALIAGKDFGLPPASGFGQAISLLTDQDNDGISDMAVGAPWAGAGVVFLLSGADGSMIQRFDAPFGADGFGTALALVGENTLAISAPGDVDLPGSIHTLNLQDRQLTTLMTDIHPGGEFGATLVPLIDMDQDGLVELAVGAPGSEHPIYPQGAVFMVYSGANAEMPTVIGSGDEVGSRFGESMVNIGDINADGLPELLIGAPGASGPAPDADPIPFPPSASIATSANGGSPETGMVRLLSLDGVVHWSRFGEKAFDHLGAAVTVISNGFGPIPYSLIAGAPDTDNGMVDAGAVHLISPLDGQLDFILHGEFEGGRLGRQLSVGVDSNGNGLPTFAVTEQMSTGGDSTDVTRFVELPDAAAANDHDADQDNVADSGDACRVTVIPELAITEVGTGRWALLDDDFNFDTSGKNNKGQEFNTTDTAGCSCEQIVDKRSLGQGHLKHGCSEGVMKSWIRSVK